MFLLICFECLACFFLWLAGFGIALGKQPEHRNWDMVARQRRADWVRNELEQRPWWWLMLSGLAMIAFVDWFMTKWDRRPWRAAMLWTIVMIIVLSVVLDLTVHFGWGVEPAKISAQPYCGNGSSAIRTVLTRVRPADCAAASVGLAARTVLAPD